MQTAPALDAPFQIVATAREVAQTVTALHAEADDEQARWPAETLAALADAGLMGLVAPRDVGGLDAGMQGVASVCEVLASESGSAALCFGMHCVGTAVIAAKSTDEQRERYLRPIAEGTHLTSSRSRSPGAARSSSIRRPRSPARPTASR